MLINKILLSLLLESFQLSQLLQKLLKLYISNVNIIGTKHCIIYLAVVSVTQMFYEPAVVLVMQNLFWD